MTNKEMNKFIKIVRKNLKSSQLKINHNKYAGFVEFEYVDKKLSVQRSYQALKQLFKDAGLEVRNLPGGKSFQVQYKSQEEIHDGFMKEAEYLLNL